MNLARRLIRKLYPFLLACAGIVLVFYLATFIDARRPRADLTDYEAVAEEFIRNSIFIANRLGKVTEIDHFGKGGDGGNLSYNAFRIEGAEDSGILNITLARNDHGEWRPSEAILMQQGIFMDVPVSQTDGGRREFLWNRGN